MKSKIETWEDAHKYINDIKIKYENKILEIEKDSTIEDEKRIEYITNLKKGLEDLLVFKNKVQKNEKQIKKQKNYFSLLKAVCISGIILIVLFFTLKSNSKIKDIIYFIASFNLIFSIITYYIWEYISKIESFFKIININILILGLGFIYNDLFFSYFGIDIIYYLTIKDYLISVYQIILILLYFGVCIFISFFSALKIQKNLENTKIKNNLIKMVIKILPIFSYFIIAIGFLIVNELFLLKPLNLSGSFIGKSQIIAFIITLATYTLTLTFFKISNYSYRDDEKKMTLLIFSINLIINIAFIDLYNFLGNNEDFLKDKLSCIEYENQFIYKIKSTENYDFYISKPENKILVFKRNLKVLEFK